MGRGWTEAVMPLPPRLPAQARQGGGAGQRRNGLGQSFSWSESTKTRLILRRCSLQGSKATSPRELSIESTIFAFGRRALLASYSVRARGHISLSLPAADHGLGPPDRSAQGHGLTEGGRSPPRVRQVLGENFRHQLRAWRRDRHSARISVWNQLGAVFKLRRRRR